MKLFSADKPVIPIRGIHLDLKGLPPTEARLIEILDILAAAKLNCVLVEWEDTYPWHCYPELRCQTAYTDDTIARFLSRANELGIEVIPLVQTFGHMQNVLVHERFADMRELPGGTGDLCPSAPTALDVVLKMVRDIIESHQGIKRIHLGGDEVWSLGTCDKCKAAVEESGKDALYLKHIDPVLDAVNAKGIRPILWDDMMRSWSDEAQKSLGARADLMCWSYAADPWHFVKKEHMDRFAANGVPMWGGSAFKGADGLRADVVKMKTRVANLNKWAREARERDMVGVIATGWSRYNTFSVPCEALEASLDALVLAGASMWDGSIAEDAPQQADDLLNSDELKSIAGDRFVKIREAARDMSRLAGKTQHGYREIQNSGYLAGETERLDRHVLSNIQSRVLDGLAELDLAAAKWRGGQDGLVDDLWLTRYVDSRLWFGREMLRTFGPSLETKE